MLRKQYLLTVALVCVVMIIPTVQAYSQGRGQQVTLPDGAGKEQVQMQCTKCHALGLITNAGGNTRQEWMDLFTTMVKLPNDQRDAIADYLTANFPPQPRPQPVMFRGHCRLRLRNGMLPPSVRGPMIRSRVPAARSGGRVCLATF